MVTPGEAGGTPGEAGETPRKVGLSPENTDARDIPEGTADTPGETRGVTEGTGTVGALPATLSVIEAFEFAAITAAEAGILTADIAASFWVTNLDELDNGPVLFSDKGGMPGD